MNDRAEVGFIKRVFGGAELTLGFGTVIGFAHVDESVLVKEAERTKDSLAAALARVLRFVLREHFPRLPAKASVERVFDGRGSR